MDLRSVDLNLLVVFDAVARERSMLRAAVALGMSPSALSHALSRLRGLVGDELFSRTSAGMEPTEHALSLVGPIRSALDIIQGSLSPVFDPSTSRHAFVVALDNRSALMLAASLGKHVCAEAPNVSLNIVPCGQVDLIHSLCHGGLDAAVTCASLERDRLNGAVLYDDDYVVLLRHDHPCVGSGRIDMEALAHHPHLSLSSVAEEDGFIDTALSELDLARHIAVRAPLLSATAILSGSDMVAVLGRKTAMAFADTSRLVVLELGIPTPRSTTSLFWHRRWDSTPAHRWLRAAVSAVAKDVCS